MKISVEKVNALDCAWLTIRLEIIVKYNAHPVTKRMGVSDVYGLAVIFLSRPTQHAKVDSSQSFRIFQ
jgi:hypothetical protein